MTLPSQRPLAIALSLVVSLALWAPTIASNSGNPAKTREHAVLAVTSPIVLM